MTTHLNSTLPARQPRREYIFAIRLTEAERHQIEALARHFILEAVAHHSTEQAEDVELEGQDAGAK